MSRIDNIFDTAYRQPVAVGYRPLAGFFATDRAKRFLLFLGDVAVLYVSLFVALFIRLQTFADQEAWMVNLGPFTLLFSLWTVIFYIGDLYEITVNKNEIRFYGRLLKVLALNCGLAVVYFYFVTPRPFDIRPQLVLMIFAMISTVLLTLWRYRFNAFVEQPAFQKNVLVVGMNEGACDLVDEILRNPQHGYRITGVVHNEVRDAHDALTNVTVYDDSVNIKDLLIERNIHTVVTAFDPRSNVGLIQQLFDSLALKVQFFELPTFYERLTGKIPVNSIGHIWFLENLARSDKSFYEFFKRTSDLVFAAVLGAITLPFIPFVILAIKLDSKGPVLFFQTRAGLLGRPFRAIKFRTMRVEAESDGVARWAQRNDPRITRIGRILRKTRIDELPQLWNVLRGEMSMIGPRPERPEFVRSLERDIPFYNERHLVKPGVTGWAQVRYRYGSSVTDSLKKLEYDFFYIKNRSVSLDLAILLKTISIVVKGEGQ